MTTGQDTGTPPHGTGQHGEHAAAPAGTPVDMGEPIGIDVHQADGVAIRWLGVCWKEIGPDAWARAAQVLATAHPDPGALHAIDWELAPFWCRGCRRCYCLDHWDRVVIMDEGFYDYSEGMCPAGHRQMLDD